MGYWSYYFLLKLTMHWGRFIDFHVWPNLAFALFTVLPLKQRGWRIARQVVAVPVGIVLLYHDSWLPPLKRAMEQKDQLTAFSLPYAIELLGRFINVQLLLGLALLFLAWQLLRRQLRMSSFAFLGIFAVAVTPPLQALVTRLATPAAPATAQAQPGNTVATLDPAQLKPSQLDAHLAEFFKTESTRRIPFPRPREEDPPMDVLYIQICSLAWDDMSYVGLRDHPLLKRFDVLFNHFNSAASYSGPAAIRLLRSNCGQPRHEDLYRPAPPECYLHSNFQQAGYELGWAMNHRGLFGDMRADISQRGDWQTTPLPLDAFKPAMKSFDGVENGYYDDYEVLSTWWKQRLKDPAQRVALYYNSGTMHDGNRFLDGSKPNTHDSYQRRLNVLLDGIGRFIDLLQASGRRVAVVLIPEHGAAARGDRMQISGLREIPTPAITDVPVGIKLINGQTALAGAPQTVTVPSSFLAVTQIIARLIGSDPYAPGANLPELLKDLPQTEPISENQGTVMMNFGDVHMMRTPDGEWTKYQP